MTDGVDIPITTPGGPEGAAVLRALADAMKSVGVETERTGQKASATRTAFSFNEIRQAAVNLYGDVTRLADGIAALATEQAQLDANSARLKLDFNAAADAAGRFTDEADAMAAATRLAEVGINLTQDQLDGLTQVAARFAQNTGTTTASALDSLTTGLITGSQRGLRPFGGELAAIAGHSHTAEERLAALTTQASHTARATDDAASSMARLRDSVGDAARTLATGFAEGLTEMSRLSASAEETDNHFEILTSDIHAAGRGIALVFGGIANGLGVVVGAIGTGVAEMLSTVVGGAAAAGAVIDRLRSGHVSGLGAAASAAYTASRSESPITDAMARFTRERVAAVGNIAYALSEGTGESAEGPASPASLRGRQRGGEDGGSGGSSRADEHAKSAKAAQMAMDQQDRERRTAQMRVDREFYAELVRQAREYENAIHGAAVQWGEQVTHADEVARITARVRGLETSGAADAEVRLQRARMAQQRAEGGIAARAETEDLRDPAAQRERIEEMRQQRALQRERSHLEQRYQLQRTYTERMEELHGQEFDSTQALAEGSSAAFASIGEAFGKNLQAFVTGEATIGDALQGMLSDVLGSIAQQATVKGAFETAEGIAALAGVVTAGLAPGHFAAAGAYFGVAALAGLGAAAVAPSAPAAATAPAGAPRESAARLPKGGAAGDGGGTTYNVMFGGPMYGTGGVRQAARQLGGVLNRGAVQGGVQLLPGVLMGGGAGS